MDLSVFGPIVSLLFLSILSASYYYFNYRNLKKFHQDHNERTQKEIREYRSRIWELEKTPPTKLSIEAQQILHDMTTHGQSIIRITPISPTDMFWRSPK